MDINFKRMLDIGRTLKNNNFNRLEKGRYRLLLKFNDYWISQDIYFEQLSWRSTEQSIIFINEIVKDIIELFRNNIVSEFNKIVVDGGKVKNFTKAVF